MRVYLNQEDKGDWFFHIDGDDPLFKQDDLRAMGLDQLPPAGPTGQVSLKAMGPDVKYQIREKEPAIYIVAPPEMFAAQSIAGSRNSRPRNLHYVEDYSASLTYAIDYVRRKGSNGGELNIPLAATFYGPAGSLQSTYRYTNDDRGAKTVRLLTALTRDNRDAMTRLTLGDFAAATGAGGGGGLFGGISYTRVFSIDPYFRRTSGVTISGIAKLPSRVDYYLGDRLLLSRDVSPGAFELRDMIPPAGAQRSRMVVTDMFGNEQVLNDNFYYAPGLLRPGVHEFSYNAGLRRELFGQQSDTYGDFAILGFHRFGVSDSLTLGGRGEFTAELANIGAEAAFRVRRFGEVAVRLSTSKKDSARGLAGSLDYRYVSPGFSVNLRLHSMSKHYSNLNLDPDYDRIRFEWRAGLSANARAWGNWSVSYTNRERHSGEKSRLSSLFVSRRFGRFATLVARYSRISGSGSGEEVFVTVSRPFGGRRFGSIDYARLDDTDRLTARIAQNRPLGTGLGFDARTNIGGDLDLVDLGIEYAAPRAEVYARYTTVQGQHSSRIGARGSVSWIGGGLHLSRPISDSFSLVRIGDLTDVDVLLNNQFMGQTNGKGELLIPRLSPYFGNRISFDDDSVPINYDIPALARLTATPFRGGGITRFDVKKVQGVTGQVFVVENGIRAPAEYWGWRYLSGDDVVETIVGKSGEFYLENVPAGETASEIFWGEKTCNLTLNVPQSKKMYINLGEIDCEISH